MIIKKFNRSLTKQAKSFSTDTANFRVPVRDPNTQRLTDEFLHTYSNPMFSAYIQKRKLKRSEIWPKIHILKDPPANQLPHIKSQKLYTVRKLLDEALLKRIAKEDPTQINSIFIISLFSEDNFKELLDQYVSKVMVCGKAPSQESYQQMQKLEQQTINYCRMFYFGEKISPLEREIEINYLASKQTKFYRSQMNKKNVLLKCLWQERDQRLLEDYVNWPDSNINLVDLSYRPYYEPLNIFSRLPYVEKFYLLTGGSTLLNKLAFSRTSRSYVYSIAYLNWVKQKLFSRVIQYTKCLQFTHNMKVPADFTIQLFIVNTHIWLIIDRLKQFPTLRSKNLITFLQKMLLAYVNDLLGALNVRKQSTMKRNFHHFLSLARSLLNTHFNKNEVTKANPYISIDALVWSTVMKEKTERYSDEVYLFSEYLIKNREHMQNFSEDDIFDGIVEFDCYLMDPDYKQKILATNPRIPQQKFDEEFQSDIENKSYYYSTQVPKMDDAEQLFKISQSKLSEKKYSFLRELGFKVGHFIKKYMSNMTNYDHFSQMDEQKKNTELKDKRSPWKTQTDRIQEAEQEFAKLSQIKKSRRKQSSNIEGGGEKKEK